MMKDESERLWPLFLFGVGTKSAFPRYDKRMGRAILTGLTVAAITALFVRIVAPPHHYRGGYQYPSPATLATGCGFVTGLASAVLEYLSGRKAIEEARRRRLGLCLRCG